MKKLFFQKGSFTLILDFLFLIAFLILGLAILFNNSDNLNSLLGSIIGLF